MNALSNRMFCTVSLIYSDSHSPVMDAQGRPVLGGRTVCSLGQVSKLGPYDHVPIFQWNDLSVAVTGSYRLRFSLWTLDHFNTSVMKTAISAPFEVIAAKHFKPPAQSTELTNLLAEQGVKLKVHKKPVTKRPRSVVKEEEEEHGFEDDEPCSKR
jgi:hypothetical protein